MANKDWQPIVERAREIMESYDTPVTLRQLFYRLVSEQLLDNTGSEYRGLSHRTARLRETGQFPHFIDQGRKIERTTTFDGPVDAIKQLAQFYYRRDRTKGQKSALYLGVEKRGITAQLHRWFDHLGIPIVPLGGYGSVTLLHDIELELDDDARPAVLIYAGDFDPSGEDIVSNTTSRAQDAGLDLEIVQIALTPEQINIYGLPINEGKPKDPRAKAFVQKHGKLIQVELDALPPDVLKRLYQDAIAQFWDDDAYTYAIEREREERERLISVAASMSA